MDKHNIIQKFAENLEFIRRTHLLEGALGGYSETAEEACAATITIIEILKEGTT